MEITPSIIDYLGSYNNGIMVSVGLMYDDIFYNSIFYYTETNMIINVEESLIEKLGMPIEEHPNYIDLLKSIIEKVESYNDVIDVIDPIKTNEN